MDRKKKPVKPLSMNVTSSSECTGMIPAALESQEEFDAYKELASFEGEQVNE